MAGEGGEGEATTLEYTPTWVVAVVCTVIVAISLAVERLLHYGGKYLKKKNQKPLFESLQKVKEELMLLGFISLLLTVFQNSISKFCVSPDVLRHMLPCKLAENEENLHSSNSKSSSSHHQSYFSTFVSGKGRRLLATAGSNYCSTKNKVSLLSTEALHHLHIFIFVLAIVHVTFCVLTVVFGSAQIRRWKHWEVSIAKDNYDAEHVTKSKVTHVRQHAFIRDRFLGIGGNSKFLGWLVSNLFGIYSFS